MKMAWWYFIKNQWFYAQICHHNVDHLASWFCTCYAMVYISGGWKIQKMVKISWLSVKKMCIWCEKFKKKFGFNWRFPWRAPAKTCSLGFGSAICQLHVICKAICGPKKFHPVCLTFDPLGLQMTTIAQNDCN